MRAVVQRSGKAKLKSDGKDYSSIDRGLMLLVGFTEGDGLDEIKWMVNKVVNLRIFDDEDGVKYLVSYDIGWGDTIAAAKTSLVKSYTMQNDGEHTVTKIEKSNITGSDTQIKNTRGLQLPSTGGMGTTLFYIIGAVLVLGAGILLVTRRRMSAN